ncbi:MAG TPA: cobyric acid synthase [Solirubrobacteraceae bacterium]|jgi:adenosylcobyric acid synthase|nr:cobyric acid synthase [Solirubrobacteraceae bacterium]
MATREQTAAAPLTETVIRSPRLALAAAPGDAAALRSLVAALVRLLRGWQIPVVLYTDAPAGDDPSWSAVLRRPIDELHAAAGTGGLHEQHNRWAIANGGDLTVLASFGDPAGDALLRTAAATRTPLVLVATTGTGTGELAAACARHAGLTVAGQVTVGDGPAADTGATPLGRVPALAPSDELDDDPDDPVAALAAYAAGGEAETGWALDLTALMVAGNGAPALVARGADGGDGDGAPRRGAASPRRAGRPRGRRGRALMVQGTHSSAGKSFLVTALARHFADLDLRVAPFKGQNMSNNARIARGGEIGVAQHLQALAARAEPDVRMNPVLLKPHDTGSHVVALGRFEPELTALPWRLRKPILWPAVRQALHELLDENDVVIVEGAGSPAEPYMYHNDIVNMRIAREASAATILVSDAGQGGAIAQSYGTWRMIPEGDRHLIRGFVFNKFYAPGYVDLFLPGADMLERLTGVPSLGVLPMLDFSLPEEDLHSLTAGARPGERRLAVLAYPRISNFDEFAPLEHVPGLGIVWARTAEELADADVLVLPGSKNVPLDLAWMRERGLDDAVRSWAQAGKPVLGICGGLQMLGERIEDPAGVEGSATGLGLLPLETVHHDEKVQTRTQATFGPLGGPWEPLSGVSVDAYEIRFGRTRAVGEVTEALPGGTGFADGNVLAISLHGIFENQAVVEAVFGVSVDNRAILDEAFDAASAALAEHLDMARLEEIVLA